MVSKTTKSKHSSKSKPKFSCDYCKKAFVHENSLVKHSCEPKRRWHCRNDKENQIAFGAYAHWNKIAMAKKHEISYETFMTSKLYTSFVKFAKYIISAKVANWQLYLEWVTQNQLPIDAWSKDSTLNRSRKETSKRETPARAVERFVLLSDAWAQEHNDHWSNYWQAASINLIIFHIQSGKLSPWVLFGSHKAQVFLDSVPDDLFPTITSTIDVEYWHRKAALFKEDLDWVHDMLD